MTSRVRAAASAIAATIAVLTLAACAASPASDGSSTDDRPTALPTSIPAPGQVSAQGTVLQKDGDDAQLCLGAVAESYPPQCTGLPIAGWDWDAVDGEEAASGVTWGAYAVWGTWDGATFTLDEATTLALYDPMPVEEPLLDPANAGDTSEAELLAIQERIAADDPFPTHGSWSQNGYLFVEVDYDDGTYQEWADDAFGPDRVAIRSLLRDV